MGSTAGVHLYTGHGWIASSGLSLGLLGLNVLVLLARGPHARKWIGWDGGARLTKVTAEEQQSEKESKEEVGSGSLDVVAGKVSP